MVFYPLLIREENAKNVDLVVHFPTVDLDGPDTNQVPPRG
jgi:hypothetical protein